MTIACLQIPRFAVEAERQRPFGSTQDRRPDVASRLILVGEAMVLDCSLGAEASGVRRGMRMSEAIGLCHRAVVLPPDGAYYQRLFDEILDYLDTLSPVVERGEQGLAYLLLDGLPVQPGEFAEGLIAGVHRRFGFMASAGVAGGKFPARVAAGASRPGATRIVPRDGERDFLAPLPVDLLPLTDAMRWRLDLLGIVTMGDIAKLALGPFQAQFGPEGKRCWELAQGIDEEPLVPRVNEETVVRRLSFRGAEGPAPAVTLDAIMVGVERLVQAAYADSVRGGRWVRKAVVRALLDGGGTWELPVVFREALSDPKDAWFAIKSALARRAPERPVEELELELVGLSAESGKQATMFEGKGKLWRQVEEAVRQLGVQGTGRPAMGRVMEVEPWSRIPERRAALVDFDSSV
jgi:DNA polymerase-4/protein ImuB